MIRLSTRLSKGVDSVNYGDNWARTVKKSPHNSIMTILPRLISISVRKYASNPENREPAVKMMLRNVIRLAVVHLGREQAASLALEALQEPAR